MQTEAMYFLMQHDMDFNKWIKQGIPYLNKTELSELEKTLYDEREIDFTSFSKEWEEEKFIEHKTVIEEWIAGEEPTLVLEKM